MNIIILNDFAHVNGGSSAVAVASAQALHARGHTVSVFAAVPPIAPEIRQAGIETVCLDQSSILDEPNRARAAVSGLWNWKAAEALDTFLRSHKTRDTVVHLHSWTKALSSSVVPVLLSHKLPLFLTLHDYFYACPNGGFYDYRAERICERRPLSLGCISRNCDARRYAHKLWRTVRQVIQNGPGRLQSDRIHFLCVSAFSRRLLAPALPRDAKVSIIPNPVEVTRQAPADPSTKLSFVAVGRIEIEKGLHLLAEAAAPLERPVVFIGDGSLRTRVKTLCRNARISGWLSRAEVNAELRQARALVFPSLLPETLGLSVLEAAAQGIPAVVGDQSAATDFVEDGVNGLHFRMGDPEDLRRVLRRLDDDNLVARLGRAAYDRYWSTACSLEQHAEMLEALYHSALSGALKPH